MLKTTCERIIALSFIPRRFTLNFYQLGLLAKLIISKLQLMLM